MRVVHRYIERGWYTPENATAILLGTFPSVLIREAFGRVRPTDVDFFYGSGDNNFWPDLSSIYKRPLSYQRTQEAVQQRMDLLRDLGLGISDAIYACTTTGGAVDTALQNIEINTQLLTILDKHPDITKLYFTSSSGKVNAESLTMKMLKESGRISSMKITQANRPRMRQFLFRSVNGAVRTITTITLISPSPLAEKMAGIKPEERRALYAKQLPKLKH